MAAPPPSPPSPESSSSTSPTSNEPLNPSPSTFLPPEIKTPLLYGTLIISPILLLLPPRKLDLYTFALGGAWLVSARELAWGELSQRQWRRQWRGGIADGIRDGGEEEEEAEEEEVGGVMGMVGRVFGSGSGSGSGAGKARVGVDGKGDGVNERWRREEEVRARQAEVEEKGYSGVIIGEVREALGRDRDTGERVRKGK